jgi:hypothetical protein
MPASSEFPHFFTCNSGHESDPDSEIGLIGSVYRWDGEWIRSPEEVVNSDKNPIMKLAPVDGRPIEVEGDVGCFTEVDSPQGDVG